MHLTNNPIIKHKAGQLNLAEEIFNISEACKAMGVSRDTLYCYQELAEEGDIDALVIRTAESPTRSTPTVVSSNQHPHVNVSVTHGVLDICSDLRS